MSRFGSRGDRDSELPLALERAIQSLAPYQIAAHRLSYPTDGSPFAQGGFCEIRLAELCDGNPLSSIKEKVVVKSPLPLRDVGFVRAALRLAREMVVWVKLDHPNILKFKGFFIDQQQHLCYIICPFATHGNVTQYLERSPDNQTEKFDLINDVSRGLAFLHALDPPVCHGDLKAANVLVGSDRQAMLCDFGLAAAVGDEIHTGLTTSGVTGGSTRWCSPEVIDGGKRTTSSDIWSWAMLVLEIITGRVPYHNDKREVTVIRRIAGGIVPTPDDFPELGPMPHLWSLLEACWVPEASARVGIGACFEPIYRTRLAALQDTVPRGHIDLELHADHPTDMSGTQKYIRCILGPNLPLYMVVYGDSQSTTRRNVVFDVCDDEGTRWSRSLDWGGDFDPSFLDVAFDDRCKLLALGNMETGQYEVFRAEDGNPCGRLSTEELLRRSRSRPSSMFVRSSLLAWTQAKLFCGWNYPDAVPSQHHRKILLDFTAEGSDQRIERVFVSPDHQYLAVLRQAAQPPQEDERTWVTRTCRVWRLAGTAPIELGEELSWFGNLTDFTVLGFTEHHLVGLTQTRLMAVDLLKEKVRFYRLPVLKSGLDPTTLPDFQCRGMQFVDDDWFVIPEEGISNSGPGLKLHFCDPVWLRDDIDQDLSIEFTWTMDPDQELESISVSAGTAITRRKNSPLRPDRLEVWAFGW